MRFVLHSHGDRIIAGGIMPVNEEFVICTTKELGVDYFLERREMGIINLGGEGEVELDDTVNKLGQEDGLYVGMGHSIG